MRRFKNHQMLLSILMLAMLIASANAEVPNVVNYQGRLTDNAGQPITGSKLMKFKIYGSPAGDDSLWSSAFRAVQIDDGLFNVQLGSVVPLPGDLFIGNDSRYLGITIDTDAEIAPRTQFITAPYSLHAVKADTSEWSLGGPGAGAWYDEGDVIRLATFTDRVGIGPMTAGEPLVVGQDLGSFGGSYIVSGSPYLDDLCGFKMGYGPDDHTTLDWNGDGNPFAIHTRQGGVNYNNTLVLNLGMVGINNSSPAAPLDVSGNATISGRLGVGISSPSFAMELKSSGYSDGFRITSSDGSQLFRIRESSAGSCEAYISDNAGNTGALIRGEGSSYFNSGKVAIGTSSPDHAALYVYEDEVTGVDSETSYDEVVAIRADASDFSSETRKIFGIRAYGTSTNNAAAGIRAYGSSITKDSYGIYAKGNSDNTDGYYAYGILATTSGSCAGQLAGGFFGNVTVFGNLAKTSGSFIIDHPLDPENKYLQHSFVESPDMMNVYNGNVILDNQGKARVEMPDWFESLNREFRYQLTCIGSFAPVYIDQEISGNSFSIAGGTPGMKVSWQVTGIRQDPWAEAHRIQVEIDKRPSEIGLYRHPEVYNLPEEKGIRYHELKNLDD